MIENFGVSMIKNVCGQSGDRALKLTVSQECTNEVNRSFAFDTDSQKLKVDQNFFGWSWPKMGVVSLVTGL